MARLDRHSNVIPLKPANQRMNVYKTLAWLNLILILGIYLILLLKM